ncbi:uncharacterized protein LOC117649887 [Thrips palmi]|uniref:Uncharacterized protein LOC117649887 n=1 Tax=Thrips palmi TaxID=161013 RepID=A0A6P8ZUI6_THRPL|nr:uncharacterized protein LOC117649887 [Thrips palmi]
MGLDGILFHCHYCQHTSVSFKLHLSHRDCHRHINNNKYFCGVNRCEKVFNRESVLRKHILRHHALKVSQLEAKRLPPTAFRGKYICSVGTCKKEFDVYKGFLSHLNFHLSQSAIVECPYTECFKKYKNKKSFSSHLSRSHRSAPPGQCGQDSSSADAAEDLSDYLITEDIPENCFVDQGSAKSGNEEHLLLQNLAHFFMKLEYHHLVPETVIQYVYGEMSHVFSQGLAHLDKEIRRQMEHHNIPSEKIQLIMSSALKNDPFSKTLCDDLRSDYMRKEFYKKTFPFVQPEKIEYVRTFKNKRGELIKRDVFFYYISIEETLRACFLDKSLNLKLEPAVVRTDDIISDVTDGLVFLEKGSSSRIRWLCLVALCKEKDFVHEVVYGRIVKDLKVLERDGMYVEGVGNVKVGLTYIAGDNLGSHQLGGFVCNFSSAKYFCRFCHIEKEIFHSKYGETVEFELRTVESYEECLRLGKSKKYGHKGVKFDSEFNELEYFHACKPGLSSCVGHDYMEGCIAFDLKLFIDYFISESWFTLHELNEAIDNFDYSKEEKRDKPPPVQEEAERVKGGAWQVWTLLRLFPLIMQNFILDDTNKVWQALMLLSEITEIVCAPGIHKSILPYLHCIIIEYLTVRKALFPEVPLRPKHHFMSHTVLNYLFFGPLLKCWTMRYESKHSYFKRIARVVRCFKNILFTFAMKHELLQCYLRSGADLRCDVAAAETSRLFISNYSKNIRDAITATVVSPGDLEESKIVMSVMLALEESP